MHVAQRVTMVDNMVRNKVANHSHVEIRGNNLSVNYSGRILIASFRQNPD